MPGRRASQRRVEEREKSDEATEETGGRQRPSKGHTQGRGHGKHTASRTPQRSTGEGRNRGTGERQHHPGRHRPHSHHTHRTHTHPRPLRVASGPRQPAQRAGSREPGAPEPRRLPPPPSCAAPHRAREPQGQCRAPTPAHPHPQHVGSGPQQPARRAGSRGRGKAPPPRTPFRHPHSAQRWPARAHAVGPVLGPHACTDRIRDTRVAEPRLPAPEDRRLGERQRLTPDGPQDGGRPPPPGTAPHHPRGMQPPQGIQARGTVLGPHTRTSAPRARGWRTPTARLEGGQAAEGNA